MAVLLIKENAAPRREFEFSLGRCTKRKAPYLAAGAFLSVGATVCAVGNTYDPHAGVVKGLQIPSHNALLKKNTVAGNDCNASAAGLQAAVAPLNAWQTGCLQ
jgi:hypothetical protein